MERRSLLKDGEMEVEFLFGGRGNFSMIGVDAFEDRLSSSEGEDGDESAESSSPSLGGKEERDVIEGLTSCS